MEVLYRVRRLALVRTRFLLPLHRGDSEPHSRGDFRVRSSPVIYPTLSYHACFIPLPRSIFDGDDGAQHVFSKAAAVAGLTDVRDSSLDEKSSR